MGRERESESETDTETETQRKIPKEREGERGGRERERARATYRQTDRQTGTGRQKHTETERHTQRDRDRESERHRQRETQTETDRDRQRQTERAENLFALFPSFFTSVRIEMSTPKCRFRPDICDKISRGQILTRYVVSCRGGLQPEVSCTRVFRPRMTPPSASGAEATLLTPIRWNHSVRQQQNTSAAPHPHLPTHPPHPPHPSPN